MATTTPPRPPSAPPPHDPPPARPVGPSRGRFVRPLALGALAVVVLVVAFIVLAPAGSSTYKLEFAEGDQLVRGDQVQVGGVPVGSVKDIALTHDFKAVVTISVDSSLTPLHAGTTAQVRVPSLSSVANRYIALSPGPNNAPALPSGARLPASATGNVTDLDQLFNTLNPKTRKGLQQFVQGTAEQYVGQGKSLQGATEYFAPSLSATDHFFAELVRDQSTFTKFLVETAKAVTTIGARKTQLSDLVENANTTFTAIGSEQTNLAQGLKRLPVTLRQGNRTFADLPSTFAALRRLVVASRPTVKPLNQLFSNLQPLLTTATPVVKNFATAFSQPGANNDLTDFVRALPGLAASLETSTPAAVTSLQGIGADHRLLRAVLAGAAGHAAPVRSDDRLLRRQRPLRADQPGVPRLHAEQQKHADAGDQPLAGAGAAEDRPAAPLPGGAPPSRPPTAPRLSPTLDCSAATPPSTHEPAAQHIPGGQPAADRGGDDADRRRGGVPLLQRQQRAAVRADVQHQSRAAPGLGPAALQPGAHRRHARGHHRLADAAPGPGDGQGHGDRQPEARKERRTVARGHQGDGAVGLGDRPEVPGTGKGQLREDDQGRPRDPGEPGDRTCGHRSAVQHVRRKDAHGDPAEHEQLRRRPGRTRSGNQRSAAHAQAARDQRDPRAAQPRLAADRPARPVQRARPARRTDGAGGRAERHVLQRAGHLLHRLRGRREVARRSHRGRPGIARTGDLLAALRGAVHGKEHTVHGAAAPERESADDRRQAARRRDRRRRDQPQGGDQPEHAPGRVLPGAAEVRAEPGGHGGAGRLHADAAVRQPGARRPRARAGLLQLPHADLPQRREPAVGEHRHRHARSRRPGARSERPEQRGLPVLGARQRSFGRKSLRRLEHDRRQQPRARQPLPERRRARSAARLRSGQRDV